MTLVNKNLEQFIDLIAKRQVNEPFLDLSERKIQNVVFFSFFNQVFFSIAHSKYV
jgi:hypothetical protein